MLSRQLGGAPLRSGYCGAQPAKPTSAVVAGTRTLTPLTRTVVRAETEPAMRNAIRGFLVLSLLLWLIAAFPGTPVPGAGGATPAFADDREEDEDECNEPGDADQVAAVRAMATEQCDCDGASNHGKYVSCVAHVVNEAVGDGLLRAECSDAVVGCAAASTCGRPGFVTCCQTDADGNTTCSIKNDAENCETPPGGTACVRCQSSCCDACGPGGTCPPPGGTTTTTTVPTETTTTTAPVATTTTTGPVATTTTSAPVATTTTSAPVATTTTSAPVATTTTSAPVATTTTSAPVATTTTSAPVATTTTSAPVATTTTTIVTTTTTTTLVGCCGFSPMPSELTFTTGIGSGNCGTVQSSAGATLKSLACGGLFTRGGRNSVPLPHALPDI